MTLKNDGDEPVHVQVRAFRWHQEAGRDALHASRDLVASPPIATIPPGIEQVIRIVRPAKSAVVTEESYRLFIEELPDLDRRRKGRVNVLLRYSVPVFVTTPGPARGELEWRLDRDREGLVITAANRGETHVQISNLRISTGQGPEIPLRHGLVGYVLGGSMMQWAFGVKLPKEAVSAVRLLGQTSEGGFDVAVAVGGRH